MYGLRGSAAAKTVKNVIKPTPSPQRLRNPHSKVLTVLGVETSADDSCAAVVTSDRRILSNVVIRQDE
ncbi:uncharacterized protein B0H18DRAFT_1012226 [Fomitopsis serialis]|uniref:uncharacterized protein n=1 Tax=Fomitopsis serialis TaxID=139415 RepID=UPI002007F9E4|nr:uncharacterized protein B0H18DRAFT_1012226 [Neoantrodia serialis]KAH9924444.1 hypothetical protein B0H18DRAFT_1012226 [Neoantrodia serialis]